NQPVAVVDEQVDHARPSRAVLLQRMHACPGRRGERGLRAGEKPRNDDAKQDRPAYDPQGGRHSARFSSSRKAMTSDAGTSRAMKARPTPCVRIKVSAPRLTFLSCFI